MDNQSSTDKAVTAAQELVSKKVSVVLGSYGSGLATYFVNAFEDLGGTVTSEQFPEGTSDFSAYIKKASDGAFELVKTQSVEG